MLTLFNVEGKKPDWDGLLFSWLGLGLVYLLCLPYASTQSVQTAPVGWLVRGLLWIAPALLIGYGLSAHPDLRRLLLPARGQSLHPAWYIGALLFFPLSAGLGFAIDQALGAPAQINWRGTPLEVAITLLASFIYITLFGGPFGEEAGWRGFALPRLQAHFSPLLVSLVLGAAWFIWRLPLTFTQFSPTGLAGSALNAFLPAVLITWLYNRTGGNLPACLLLHAGLTAAGSFLPITPAFAGIVAASSLAAVWVDRMWRKIPA
jgi:membrane protease YdiL (CAAX protease family)